MDHEGATTNEDTPEVLYQVKINPWSMVPLPESDRSRAENAPSVGRPKQEIILVASLIDKAPNLGGLSRTCEIFGVSRMVVSDLSILENPSFLRLTMSSEKWLDFEAVPPVRLAAYLTHQRSQGYLIVGIEQTIGSQKLNEYQFPDKIVLVLGAEAQGIPADILSLLDVAIEIPQLGMTRSLNVHVSGSIVLWEYTKQHLTEGSAIDKLASK